MDRDQAALLKCAVPVLLVMFLPASRPAVAQGGPSAHPSTQLPRAFDLIQEGQFSAAISAIKPLLDSGNLSGKQTGRAWSALGFAYEQESLFPEAHKALDRAIEVLGRDPDAAQDYATALSYLGDLSQDEGQFDAAEDLWRKAAKVREHCGSWRESAVLYTDLAELMVKEHHVRQARKYLERADSEASSAGPLDAGARADLAEAHGWLALEEKRLPEAVADYQTSLGFCKIAYGENHFRTAWAWTLIGKALAEEGRTEEATADLRHGLNGIEQTLGTRNATYWATELAYARALDRAGSHAEAKRVKKVAEEAMNDFYRSECAGCIVNASAFR